MFYLWYLFFLIQDSIIVSRYEHPPSIEHDWDLDAAQIEFWELQKKHMIQRHLDYMDPLDAFRGFLQKQNSEHGLASLSKVASSMSRINMLHDLDQI